MHAAPILRYGTSGVLIAFALLAGLFAAGYAYTDLRLRLAILLTVGWLTIAGGLGFLAWSRPDRAVPVLGVITIITAGTTIIDSRVDLFGRDDIGPVMTMVIVAILVPPGSTRTETGDRRRAAVACSWPLPGARCRPAHGPAWGRASSRCGLDGLLRRHRPADSRQRPPLAPRRMAGAPCDEAQADGGTGPVIPVRGPAVHA